MAGCYQADAGTEDANISVQCKLLARGLCLKLEVFIIPLRPQDDDEEIRQVTSAAVSVAGASASPHPSGTSSSSSPDRDVIAGSSEMDGRSSISVSGLLVPFYISVVQVSGTDQIALISAVHHFVILTLLPLMARSRLTGLRPRSHRGPHGRHFGPVRVGVQCTADVLIGKLHR